MKDNRAQGTEACCDACAAPPSPPITIQAAGRGRAAARRGSPDRQLTMLAILLAGGFLGLALLALLLGPAFSLPHWLPLHLLLAGAAGTAIAGVMPFFSAAVSGAPPADARIRLASIVGVAFGALLVVSGWTLSSGAGSAGSLVAGLGGCVYLAGFVGVAAATLLPLRAALGPRRIFMGAIYGLALVNVLLGAGLSTLSVLGWPPVAQAWATLKPAHAWLNVFGFLSLVIAGSLLHLLPTVVGARIRRTAASMVAFVGLAVGPPLVAGGFAVRLDPLALAGAGATVMGAAGLAWHSLAVLRSRARWSTDASWHRFTGWSLAAGVVWFVLGVAIAAGQLVESGATPAGWRLDPLIAPLAVGWAAQVLVGAWSHLLPAIGPGTSQDHARQRRLLGFGGEARVALLNAGVAGLVLAGPLGLPLLAALGVLAVAAAGAIAVGLLGSAVAAVLGGPNAGLSPARPSDQQSGGRSSRRERVVETPDCRLQREMERQQRGSEG